MIAKVLIAVACLVPMLGAFGRETTEENDG